MPSRKGNLKKTSGSVDAIAAEGSNRTERSLADAACGHRMGIATPRETERVAAAFGQIQAARPMFEPANTVCPAGVLFMLPALIAHGLLKGKQSYKNFKKGYYGLSSILLLLAYMSMSRIKSPEQLKTCKPGELGKVLGLDRVPEAKCLSAKIQPIVSPGKAGEFNRSLSQKWIAAEETAFFYVDGHVLIYHGYLATLTKK
jgi:hypothetical protein